MLSGWRFEFFYSPAFWAALACCVIAVRALKWGPRARTWLLLACSTALLLGIPRFGVLDLFLVWALTGFSFAVVRALQRLPGEPGPGSRRLLAALGIAGVLSFLALFKYRGLQQLLWLRSAGTSAGVDAIDPLVPGVFLVGVSYFSFKAIHVIVESYKRSIVDVDLLSYLTYMTFFPSFISGPINRYGHFAPQLTTGQPGSFRDDFSNGATRIIHGLFKKLVLVPIVFPFVITNPARPLGQQSIGGVLIGLYAFAAYTYFDFAGYSDLAIGAARLLGLQLPENFDKPFLQRNIRELWAHWHMSLTSWLVDYVYWPLVRKLRNLEFFRSRPVLLSAVGMNVVFLACGAWHGEAWNFILWGAYHGAGITVLTYYQRWKRRIPLPWLQRYFGSRTSRVLGAVAAGHFFVFGTALFALDLTRLHMLVRVLAR